MTELGKDWWHLREELLSLRREGVLAFADPLTPETRIELRSP